MDFKERLERAAERGQQTRDQEARQAAAQAMSEKQWRRLHSDYRHTLTEHIESCLRQLAENFPGFRYETVVDEKGWGAAVSRDDLSLNSGQRKSMFSRLALTISPHNDYHVLELIAKGTVRNKENFNRNHYQLLKEADLDSFRQFTEQWTLDYAEQYAASDA
jgi:hypothetical protein